MIENQDRLISATPKDEEQSFDSTLRPKRMAEFVGQQKIKNNLKVFIEAAQKRKEPMEHLLLHGPAGIGKTTLANIIASEMGVNIRTTSGPAIEKAGDIAAVLTNLEDDDVLFIDEIHRMNRIVEEVLYPAMEDFALDIMIGKGPSAKSLRLDLPRFTIIGATTRVGMLSSPLRDRFGSLHRLDFYSDTDIEKILKRSARILDVEMETVGAAEIAKRSRRTPRIANRLLKRIRDYAQVKADGIITMDVTDNALKMLEVDELGLDEVDRKLLQTMIEKFNGGPVGLQSLAAVASEESETVEEVYEPFLLQMGFIVRTPKGRVVTEKAYSHLGIKYNQKQQEKLF
ncbi:MAG: Holliday junction branch migration DNA helicase RuvB [Parcubacteria group bacterium]|nr:Holliday junction branch migration DNA helicase RuvB [Parcubacteria group bacterium]